MAKAKTEIIIDGVAYPVIKELEFNYVIQYGNDKRLFNKRKKRLVGSGYNDKKQKKNATDERYYMSLTNSKTSVITVGHLIGTTLPSIKITSILVAKKC